MRRIIKKVVSVTLAAALTITGLSVNHVDASAENTASKVINAMSEDGSNTITDILSDEIAESGKHDSDKFYISDITVKNGIANVVCQTIASADLVVAVYEESSGKMTASGSLRVNPDDIKVDIELMGDIPQYYVVKGYLADSISHVPLCDAYTCELYTEEMQEIMSATIYDYDEDKVLNLDGDSDNNFAVFNENVVITYESDYQNIMSSVGSNRYIFESAADEVIAIEPGKVLAVKKDDGNIIVISVGAVTVNGDDVTIEDAGNLDTKDIFEVVKIDTECDNTDMSVDTTDMDEELTFEGVVDSSELQEPNYTEDEETDDKEDVRAMAFEGGGKLSKSLKYKVDAKGLTKTEEADTVETPDPAATKTPAATPNPLGDVSFAASGSLALTITGEVTAYISPRYKYISAIITGNATVDIVFGVEYTKTFNLGKVLIPTGIAGINVTFTPAVTLSASGKMTFIGTLYTAIGGAYDSNDGFVNKCTAPSLKGELNVKAIVSVGLSGTIAVEIIDDEICSASLTPSVSAELVGSETIASSTSITMHECGMDCIDGDINICADISIKINIGPWEKGDTLFNVRMKLCDFYYSIARNEFGWGTCPYIAYKVTINVKNVDKSASAGAVIGGTGISPAPVTDDSGSISVYLRNGTYAITAANSNKYGRKDIQIDNKPTTCTIIVNNGTDITKQMKLFGDAVEEPDGSIRLTTCNTWEGGCVWYPNAIDTTKGFAVSFSYRAGGGRADSYGGADGIVLDFATKTGIGDEGGNIGFVNGYGVELDSYPENSGDPESKHIAVVAENISNHLTSVLDDRVDDGAWHDIEVFYQRDLEVLTVYLDNNIVLSCPNVVMKNNVYIGLTAATGDGKNYHYVSNFVITTGNHDIAVMNYGDVGEFEGNDDFTLMAEEQYSIMPGVRVGNVETSEGVTKAIFNNLEPNEKYLLVHAFDTSLANLFEADNLLYINQGIADENGKLEFSYIPKNTSSSSIRLYGATKFYSDNVIGNRPVIGGGKVVNVPIENHPIIQGDLGKQMVNNVNNQQALYTQPVSAAKKIQKIKLNPSKKTIKKSSIGKKGKKLIIKVSGKIKGKISCSCSKKFVKVKLNKSGKKATVTITKKAKKGVVKIFVKAAATSKYKRAKKACVITIK